MFALRPYQQRAVNEIMQYIDLDPLLQMATGGGKTRCANEIASLAEQPALVVTHRREILKQTVASWKRFAGEDPAVIDADTYTSAKGNKRFQVDSFGSSPIVIGSQQTLYQRCRKKHWLPDFKLIIFDEAHHIKAPTWMFLREHWPNANAIGLTATPMRGDGQGLGGDAFGMLVQGTDYGGSYTDLIRDGYLVDCPPTEIYSWPFDTKGIRKGGGDYLMGGDKGAAKRLDIPARIGDQVNSWCHLALGRPTIYYASSVDHALHARDRFIAAGVRAACLHHKTDPNERDDMIASLSSGALDVITNFGILTEGTDIPEIACIQLDRLTANFGLYMQMVGRGLRTAPAKRDLLLLDHVGMVPTHGFPTQDVIWDLNEDKPINQKEGFEAPTAGAKQAPSNCPVCNLVMIRVPCQGCGWKPSGWLKAPPFELDKWRAEGHLTRMADQIEIDTAEVLLDPRLPAWENIENQRKKYNKAPGWAAHKFKEMFDSWPLAEWSLPDPLGVTPDVYLRKCLEFAEERKWKMGWAAFQYKKIYGCFPKKSLYPT